MKKIEIVVENCNGWTHVKAPISWLPYFMDQFVVKNVSYSPVNDPIYFVGRIYPDSASFEDVCKWFDVPLH